MSAEKLPPDGYELEPGWEVGGGFCCTCRHWKEESVYRHDPLKRGDADASCGRVECAIAMGAIVRKAEAPTACDVCGDPEPHVLMVGECFTRTEEEKRRAFPVAPAAPPEQPSGNAGQLPAEAPAAPVGEPSEARRLAHSASVSWWDADGGRCDPEHFDDPDGGPVTGEYTHCNSCDEVTALIQRAIDPRDARIAALEAERDSDRIRIAALSKILGAFESKADALEARLSSVLAAASGFQRGDDLLPVDSLDKVIAIAEAPAISACDPDMRLVTRVHDAMTNAPHDGKPYRMARAAVAVCEARISAMEWELTEADARRDEETRAGLAEASGIIDRLNEELAEAKRERDQWKHAHGEAYKVAVGASAAVQAERERCLGWWDWWWDRPDVTGSDFEDRIKNGDPAP